MKFAGKNTLVTGAAGRFGQAIVAGLLAQGAKFAVSSIDTSAISGVTHLDGDLRNASFCDDLAGHAADQLGGLDLLCNNAGVMREGTVDETSLDDWHAQIAVNLTAPFRLTRHAMPMLRRVTGGIVYIGSIAGLGNNPHDAVAPGWVDTPLNEGFINSMTKLRLP